MAADFILYSYFRSSASLRIRLALEYKKIKYDCRPVHLVNGGGEQYTKAYQLLNAMAEVPCLVHQAAAGAVPFVLAQSMAILVYLDQFPGPRLFPAEPRSHARVVQLCENINAGIHPVQNLKVMRYLEEKFKADADQKLEWAHYWIARGFISVEKELKIWAGTYSLGDEISAADFFLFGQVLNARRFKVDMREFPTIDHLTKTFGALEWIKPALPENQPDYPPPAKA